MAKFKKKYSNNLSHKNPKPKHSLKLISKELQEKYIKEIEELYQTQFKELPKQLFINSKDKIYFSTLESIPEHVTKINAIGLYLGTLVQSGHIRLSIEGTQLLHQAKDNYVILKQDYLASYLAGENLFFEEILTSQEVRTNKESVSHIEEYFPEDNKAPFVIIYDEHLNPLGTISKKEKYYLNYLSKGRKMDFNKVF